METLADTTLTLTDAEMQTIGELFLTYFGIIMFTSLIVLVLYIAATWRILEKAGEKGWKALVPIYNAYMLMKIVKMKNWFWWVISVSIMTGIVMVVDGTSNLSQLSTSELAEFNWGAHPSTIVALILCSATAIYTTIVQAWRTSKVFGHSYGYFFGLIFLPNIFQMILGFGKSEYNKKNLKK